MSDTTSPPPNGTPAETPSRPRRTLRIGAAGVAVISVAAGVGWLAFGRHGQDSGGDGTAPAGVTTVVTTAPRTSSTTGRPVTTRRGPSAADDLQPFLAAAMRLDRQLHDAATSINAGGPPWTAVSQETADAVRAASPLPLYATIPAGLPPDLLRAVILVDSDLVSRRSAMESFADPGPVSDQPPRLADELGNGHAAAARFDDDLAALRSLAAATAPIAIQPPGSRAAAEVILLVDYVAGLNSGCASRGGEVVTELPPIRWAPTATPDGDPTAEHPDGSIGTVAFSAKFGSDGRWQIRLWAC